MLACSLFHPRHSLPLPSSSSLLYSVNFIIRSSPQNQLNIKTIKTQDTTHYSRHQGILTAYCLHFIYHPKNTIYSIFSMKLALQLALLSSIILCCFITKALIWHYKIKCLPEVAGTIIIGAIVGLLSKLFVGEYIDNNIHFGSELFLDFMLPPIVFNAALSVNKTSFRKKAMPILFFAVFGTLISSFLTGISVYYSTKYIMPFPFLDSLQFGVLISSVDPIAILSVLTGLNITDKDTLYILVFGESLLNDAIVITLFKSLNDIPKESWDLDFLLNLIADFAIDCFGSMSIGIIFGVLCITYYWLLHEKLNPFVEVASFFVWSLIPYYICEALELSGIVTLITMGLLMDIYIGVTDSNDRELIASQPPKIVEMMAVSRHDDENNVYMRNDADSFSPLYANEVDVNCSNFPTNNNIDVNSSNDDERTYATRNLLFPNFKYKMSSHSYKHVRFVGHLLASISEDIIFSYLGVFLFSSKYDWNIQLVTISIFSCITSRIIMVIIVSKLIWYFHICWWQLPTCDHNYDYEEESNENYVHRNIDDFGNVYYEPSIGSSLRHEHVSVHNSKNERQKVSKAIQELQSKPLQIVLVLAGLRGAVSFSLAESMSVYDYNSGTGTYFKKEIMAMTSAAIIFTIFVFGGSAHSILKRLDLNQT